jgi:transcriptional regulator with XRE-family HTH domain
MNRGALALKKQLRERGDRAILAKDLGVTPGLVSHWVAGERKPGAKRRALIEDRFGIGWRLWDQDAPATKKAAA